MSSGAGLVVDTPAIIAYGRATPLVGQQVADMADRELQVILPALCLATAYRDIESEGWPMLDILADLPHVRVTPVGSDMCAVLGGWARTVGMDLAQAMIEAATRTTVPIITDRRKQIGGFLPAEWPIVDL